MISEARTYRSSILNGFQLGNESLLFEDLIQHSSMRGLILEYVLKAVLSGKVEETKASTRSPKAEFSTV